MRISIDWRVAFGLVITTLWIGAGLIYLLGIVGPRNFIHLPTADIGSFLEGAFAPLAFLWLVIGHFMQQKEISANTRAIQVQEESARRQEVHSQRDTYFKLLELIQQQLGAISAFHYLSVFGPSGTNEVSMEEFSEGRTRMGEGDYSYFIHLMTRQALLHREDQEALHDLFFATEVRKRHTQNYAKIFERLLKAAHEVDTDEMITDALLSGSAMGRQYRVVKHMLDGDDKLLEIFV